MSLDIPKLMSESAFWEIAGYCSAGVVTLGVAGEGVTELTNWIKSRALRRFIERASVLILLVGLAGEILSQVQANNKTSLIIGLLEQQTEQLKSDNLVLSAKIAPRQLSAEDIAVLQAAVGAFSGRQISIWSYGLDIEGRILATRIKSALDDVHVLVVDRIGAMLGSTTPRVGIIITGPDNDLVAALLAALKPLSAVRGSLDSPGSYSKSGVDMLYGSTTANVLPAEIFVGIKPLRP
jgi:hypothetical protein